MNTKFLRIIILATLFVANQLISTPANAQSSEKSSGLFIGVGNWRGGDRVNIPDFDGGPRVGSGITAELGFTLKMSTKYNLYNWSFISQRDTDNFISSSDYSTPDGYARGYSLDSLFVKKIPIDSPRSNIVLGAGLQYDFDNQVLDSHASNLRLDSKVSPIILVGYSFNKIIVINMRYINTNYHAVIGKELNGNQVGFFVTVVTL